MRTGRFIALSRMVAACLPALLLLQGCGDPREVFIGARVRDACDEGWPVCGELVGCLLGPESYAEGRFPGRASTLVQTVEPSIVTVSLHLWDLGAAGEETAILFHETECRGRTRVAIPGLTLVDEAERHGVVTREAELVTVGDHLIEFESDGQARYLVKVDVRPLDEEE